MSSTIHPGLFAIIDPSLFPDPAFAVSTLIDLGIVNFELRMKEAPSAAVFATADGLRDVIGERSGALLIVNDRADIAAAVRADGVHLGQGDLTTGEARRVDPKLLVGVSTHDLDEALAAQAGGADYLGFGAIYRTSTKLDALPPRDPSAIREVLDAIRIPVVLIGGIDFDNARPLVAMGARHLAMGKALADALTAKRFTEIGRLNGALRGR